MANKKISELDELTAVVDADVVLINDSDAAVDVRSKWATVANVMAAAPVQSVAGKSGVVTLDYTTDLSNTPTTITGTQASEISANTAKVTFPGFGTSAGTALEGNTALLAVGSASTDAMAGDTTTITTQQASDITANNAKVTNVPVATDAIWDAAGDLAVASGAAAASKLGIGTAGQVLTVNAGATAPEWAAAAGGGSTSLTINAQTGTTYTLASGDAGKLVTFDSSGGDVVVTVPNTAALGAGFYCYVQHIDGAYTGNSVSFVGSSSTVKNTRGQSYLTGPGAFGMVTNEATDEYVLSGDIGNPLDCIRLGTDLVATAGADWLNFDDNALNTGSSSPTPWDSMGGEYGRVLGSELAGHYKYYEQTDSGSDFQTAVETALGTGSVQAAPSAGVAGFAEGSHIAPGDNFYNAFNSSGQTGMYAYLYCGSGHTPTTVTVKSDGGGDGSQGSYDITVIPFIYRIYNSAGTNGGGTKMWACSLYHYDDGTNTGATAGIYETGDAGGMGAASAYALGFWEEYLHGNSRLLRMGGQQGGSGVAAGQSVADTPRGHLYL